MRNSDVYTYCNLTSDIRSLLKQAMERFGFSARAYHRILKLSRTIADLAGREDISLSDVAEAIQYRSFGVKFWN